MTFSLKAVSAAVNRKPRRYFLTLLLFAIIFMVLWGREKSPVAFHIDEIWQYSFSNSYGKGVFVLEKDDFNKWLSPTVFRDYISVQPDQRFSFDKINESARTDVHPPLSFYALNIVSSFFPNHFSKWLGLGVNIACYALTLCCLFGLSRFLFASSARALFATALWAFSLGAIDTVMYIRMYCPLTLFSVASAYFLVKYEKGCGRRYLGLVFLSFILGGMSDYIFWIFGFFLTVAFLLLRWRRHFSMSIVFAFVSLGSFVTACLVFPQTIMQFIETDSFSRQVGNTIGVADKMRQFIDVDHALNRLLDYSSDRVLYLSPETTRFLILAFLVLLIMTIYVVSLSAAMWSGASGTVSARLLGKDFSFSNLSIHNKAQFASRTTDEFFGNVKGVFSSSYRFITSDVRPNYIFLAVLLTGYSLAVIFPDFQVWTVRGFFFVYPFFSLVLAGMLLVMHDNLGISKRVLFSVLLLLALREYFVVGSPFLMRDGYEKLNKRLDDANVIFVLDSYESAGRLPNFCFSLSKAKRVYVTVISDENYRLEVLKALSTCDKTSKVMVISTFGAPPSNNIAMAILGNEFLLTKDNVLGSAIEEQGYLIELRKQYGHVFNWFNLYELKPVEAEPLF